MFQFNKSYMMSHGDLKPVRNLYKLVICYIMIPSAAIAYKLSSGSIVVTIVAAISIPLYGLLQGAVSVIQYRLKYGKAPIPISPCHGVVICGEPTTKASVVATEIMKSSTSSPNLNEPIQMTQRTKSVPLSLGCQCESMHPSGQATTTTTTFTDFSTSSEMYSNNDARRPIRLLVIGDSLAIGVGQSKQCTPIMPEVLAKTLSARLNGRVVYWTCHGAIGASTGWIIRELERGVKRNDKEESCFDDDDDDDDDIIDHGRNCSDTDESSISDESATLSSPFQQQQQQPLHKSSGTKNDAAAAAKKQRTIWRERLAQHRRYLDPDVSCQYDVVVVMAGGNDIKTGLFPFLCTGEDAEFRRQAQKHGGNYTRELLQLVQIVKRDVGTKLRHIRYTVEAAAETVIEKVEQNIELIVNSSSSPAVRRLSATASTFHELLHARTEQYLNSEQSNDNSTYGSVENDELTEEKSTKKHPLVVLPGLASRSLPAFHPVPLNWGVTLIVDILDMHKRRLALSVPDEVLYVPPAAPQEMLDYERCKGTMWQHRCQENTILALRDVRRHDCRRVEKDLREFYDERDKRQLSGDGLKRKFNRDRGWLSTLFTNVTNDVCPGLFSGDRVHPNDDGYDFYGRYIGNSIADEWLLHPNLIPPE